jgi:hypothetical protein
MRYILLLLLLPLLLIAACRAAKPIKSTSGISGMVVELSASSDCVQPSETVKLRATVINSSTKDFKVKLKDRAVFDLVVNTNDRITRWSNGKAMTSELTELELKPGQSRMLEMNWQAQCCDIIRVTAPFIYSENFIDDPIAPYVGIHVQNCVGPLGP